MAEEHCCKTSCQFDHTQHLQWSNKKNLYKLWSSSSVPPLFYLYFILFKKIVFACCVLDSSFIDNIPCYYPAKSWRGDIEVSWTLWIWRRENLRCWAPTTGANWGSRRWANDNRGGGHRSPTHTLISLSGEGGRWVKRLRKGGKPSTHPWVGCRPPHSFPPTLLNPFSRGIREWVLVSGWSEGMGVLGWGRVEQERDVWVGGGRYVGKGGYLLSIFSEWLHL